MTNADHTPLYLYTDDGRMLAYRSALWCPTCSGEGTYEVMRHTSNPAATEPDWDVIACETCGGDNEPDGGPGAGTRPVVRCATCNLPVHPEVLAIQGDYDDATFEDEEEEYDIVRRMNAEDRAKIEWCSCTPEEHKGTHALSRTVLARAAMLVGIYQRGDEGGEPMLGLHDVSQGVLLALAHESTYWRNLRGHAEHYLSGRLRVPADHLTYPADVALYSTRPLADAVREHVHAHKVKHQVAGGSG